MKTIKNSTFILIIILLISMISSVYANDYELEWVKSYYINKYSPTKDYNIVSYSYNKEKKVVFVKVREKGMEENTYLSVAGLYDESNLTITDLEWVKSYFSIKYPASQGYVIHDTYSFDSKTNIVTVEIGYRGTSEMIRDEIKCDVVVDGKAFVKVVD